MFCQVPTEWPASWGQGDATSKCRSALEESEISKACEGVVAIESSDQARLDCVADVKVRGGSRMYFRQRAGK